MQKWPFWLSYCESQTCKKGHCITLLSKLEKKKVFVSLNNQCLIKLCSFWHFLQSCIQNLNTINFGIKFCNFDIIFQDNIPIKHFTMYYEFLVPILIAFILNDLFLLPVILGQLSLLVIQSHKIVELKRTTFRSHNVHHPFPNKEMKTEWDYHLSQGYKLHKIF